jgi:hypothetical protein
MRTGGISEVTASEELELLQIVEDALLRADELDLSIVAIHLQSALDVLRPQTGTESQS